MASCVIYDQSPQVLLLERHSLPLGELHPQLLVVDLALWILFQCELLKNSLKELKNKFPEVINNYYGEGLIASVIFNDFNSISRNELASQISEKCMQKGLLVVHTGRESIKLGPPLTIDDEALLEAMSVFEEATLEVIGHK